MFPGFWRMHPTRFRMFRHFLKNEKSTPKYPLKVICLIECNNYL